MLDWTNAPWADGPKVAAYVEGRISPCHWPSWVGRALCRWRTGGNAEFYAVDRLLTTVGLHPMDLPEDVWLAEKRPVRHIRRKRRTKLDPDKVRAMRRERARGDTYQMIAWRYGVSLVTARDVCLGNMWASVKDEVAA